MVATLQHLDHPPEVFSSAQDLIAIHHHNFVTVWNFVLDSIVTWDASMEYAAVRSFAPEMTAKESLITPRPDEVIYESHHPARYRMVYLVEYPSSSVLC